MCRLLCWLGNHDYDLKRNRRFNNCFLPHLNKTLIGKLYIWCKRCNLWISQDKNKYVKGNLNNPEEK